MCKERRTGCGDICCGEDHENKAKDILGTLLDIHSTAENEVARRLVKKSKKLRKFLKKYYDGEPYTLVITQDTMRMCSVDIALQEVSDDDAAELAEEGVEVFDENE